MEYLKALTEPVLIKLVLKLENEIFTNQPDIELQNKNKDLKKARTVEISKSGIKTFTNNV